MDEPSLCGSRWCGEEETCELKAETWQPQNKPGMCSMIAILAVSPDSGPPRELCPSR